MSATESGPGAGALEQARAPRRAFALYHVERGGWWLGRSSILLYRPPDAPCRRRSR